MDRHIILGPKTQRARNILKQYGHMWTVESETEEMITLKSQKIGSPKQISIYKKDDLNFVLVAPISLNKKSSSETL